MPVDAGRESSANLSETIILTTLNFPVQPFWLIRRKNYRIKQQDHLIIWLCTLLKKSGVDMLQCMQVLTHFQNLAEMSSDLYFNYDREILCVCKLRVNRLDNASFDKVYITPIVSLVTLPIDFRVTFYFA